MTSIPTQRFTSGKRLIILPEPDRANITVLTNSLPNSPVLPWNHYDSPWLEEEEGPDDLEHYSIHPRSGMDSVDEIAR